MILGICLGWIGESPSLYHDLWVLLVLTARACREIPLVRTAEPVGLFDEGRHVTVESTTRAERFVLLFLIFSELVQ